MIRMSAPWRGLAAIGCSLLTATAQATPFEPIPAAPEALAAVLATRGSALLGEVHDSGGQHALRLAALKRYIAAGARPAIAFEQFDRERQPDIDRLRIEQPGNAAAIVALGAPGWNWKQYLPFVQLALDYNLPIIATNLSRNDAMRIGTEGWNAVFEPSDRVALGLDARPLRPAAAGRRRGARTGADLPRHRDGTGHRTVH
jgi:Haem-binding uptake, Tiki superfamily, ChaN